MQTQADVLGLRVSRPGNVETTAAGAALAAGVGACLWTEEDILSPPPAATAAGDAADKDDGDSGVVEFEPSIDDKQREARYVRWCDAVQRSLDLAPGARE